MANVFTTNPFYIDTSGVFIYPGRIFVHTIVVTATVLDKPFRIVTGSQTFLEIDMAADETKVFRLDTFMNNISVLDSLANTTKIYIYHS